jgi:hypothetical protein
MNEDHVFPNKIRKLLNSDLNLKADQAERLRAARERALSQQRTAQPALAMVFSDRLTATLGGGSGFVSQIAVSLLFLVFGLIGISYWNSSQQAADIEEIDAALLTSELPIDAYLDKGFDAWLKRSSP